MPPRHAYWTILVDDQPTAFRAHDPEELLAVLNRLKEKHPSAVMKWFERGRLWESKDAARQQGLGEGERRWKGERNRNWRPGGDHRDPRQKFKDAKKAKWQRFKQKVRDRHDTRMNRPPGSRDVDPSSFTPPHGDPLRPPADDRPQRRGLHPEGGAKGHDGRGSHRKPKSAFHGQPPWRDRPPGRDVSKPRGDWRGSQPGRERDTRPGYADKKPFGGRKPWGSKPGGAKGLGGQRREQRGPGWPKRRPAGFKPHGSGGGTRRPGPPRPRGPKKPRGDDE